MTLRLAGLALTATLALMGTSLAGDIVTAADVTTIAEIARTYGTARIETQQDGQPRISGMIGKFPYQVFFMNCSGPAGCEDINLYAGFTDTKPTLDALNEWNRDRRFGNAYLDSDLDAVIEYDVNLELGVTAENLNASFGIWSLLLTEFADYIGYASP